MPSSQRLPPASTFITEGAVEDHLFVIVDGKVRVHNGQHTLVELGPGSTVGELSALVAEPRSASVTAVETSTLLARRQGRPR